MVQMIIKVLLTAGIVVAAAELSNRSTKAAALLISLPLTSILALCWIRYDRGGGAEAAEHLARQTTSILWLVAGSIPFFLVLPPMLRRGVPFGVSMLIACAVTAACYAGMLIVLPKLGVRL
jgi:hypothetical protein